MKKIIIIYIFFGIAAISAIFISGLFFRNNQEKLPPAEKDNGSMKNFALIINNRSSQARKKMGNRIEADSLRVNIDIIKEYLKNNPQALKDNPKIRQGLLEMEIVGDYEGVRSDFLFNEELGRAGYLFFPRNLNINENVFVECEYKSAHIIPTEKVQWLYPKNYDFINYGLKFDAYLTNDNNRFDTLAETYLNGIIIKPKKIAEHFNKEIVPFLPTNISYWQEYVEKPDIFYQGVMQHEMVHLFLGELYNFPNNRSIKQLDEGLIEVQKKMPIKSRAKSVAEIHELIAGAGDISFDERNAVSPIIKSINRRTYKKINDHYNYNFNVIGEIMGKCISGYDLIEEAIKNIVDSGDDIKNQQWQTNVLVKKLLLEIKRDELICIQSSIKNISTLYLSELSKL